MSMDVEKVRSAVAEANCISKVTVLLGVPTNSVYIQKLRMIINANSIDTSHFRRLGSIPRIEITCPVCKKPFLTRATGNKRITCSHACANSFFRKGDNNPNRKKRLKRLEEGRESYYEICWRFHEKSCVVCSENKIVAVHHYNGCHSDDRPENLVPLCPTHHQYWHSKHRHEIQDCVDSYVKNFKRKQ